MIAIPVLLILAGLGYYFLRD